MAEHPNRATSRRRIAVVLAAGKGTRMRSRLPKVLHQVGGRPLLAWVLEAARASGCEQILVVVGHGSEEVRSVFDAEDLRWVEQREQLGTGHALAQVASEVQGEATLLVLSGDVPLVRPQTLQLLAEAAEGREGAMAIADLEQPGSLGRVLTRADGGLARIVEAADASEEELAVTLINAGLYALPAPQIFEHLRRLQPDNAKGELYLTDAVGRAAGEGSGVSLVTLADPSEAWGVNTRQDLAKVHRRLVERHLDELMSAGVTILEPGRTVIEPSVQVGADTVVEPGVTLLGNTRIGEGCYLRQGCWLRDCHLAQGVEILPYSVLEAAQLGSDAAAGPFARLRPGSEIGHGARIGNFVEVKNSQLGPGVKAGHLSYLGDATIGEGANIGAGTVTCNYDGKAKHRTEIGAGAFIGSDSMLVAPVSVGAGATTAAGSTINQDVPDQALGVARARQRNISDWAQRQRGKAAAPGTGKE